MVRTKNRRERIIVERLESEGFVVLKNGWPDFAAVHPDGRIRFVEVKPPGGCLSSRQRLMKHLVFDPLGLLYEVAPVK